VRELSLSSNPTGSPPLSTGAQPADHQAWAASLAFAAGHAQHRDRGQVGTASELWSFDALEREDRRWQQLHGRERKSLIARESLPRVWGQ
jgi:hypothetical protein